MDFFWKNSFNQSNWSYHSFNIGQMKLKQLYGDVLAIAYKKEMK